MDPQPALRLLRRLLPVLPPPFRKALQPLFAPAVSTRERLADFPTDGLPLERPVVIRWNEHQVPFIEAETDRDLAFAFGMVHQHLRGGQIALFKRFFYGRVSEMAGPLARDLDHAIRILDYGHAADAWEKRMPEETRVWVQAFVDGLNTYQDRGRRRPPEFALLGIEPEPFTFRDILVGSPLRRHRLHLAHLLPAAGASAGGRASPRCGTERWRPASRRRRAPGRTRRRASSRICC